LGDRLRSLSRLSPDQLAEVGQQALQCIEGLLEEVARLRDAERCWMAERRGLEERRVKDLVRCEEESDRLRARVKFEVERGRRHRPLPMPVPQCKGVMMVV
jgi:hypothetical protein